MTDVLDGKGRLHHMVDRWKAILAALGSALVAVWISVTWAEDKIKKIERVPALEEAVLQMKVNQELMDARMTRMELQLQAVDRIAGGIERIERKLDLER